LAIKRRGLTEAQLKKAKCKDSPTGAHHWIIGSSERAEGTAMGECKYCGERRRFNLSWPIPGGSFSDGSN